MMRQLLVLLSFLFMLPLALEAASPRPLPPGGPLADAPVLPEEFRWQGIQPGHTTPEELHKRLGKPKNRETYEDGAEGWQYDSGHPMYPHELIVVDGKLTLAARYAGEGQREALQSRIDRLGKPAAELFTFYAAHYKVHVWAELGYLAIADHEGAIVEEQWFAPQTIARFLEENREKFPQESPYLR